MNKTSALGGGRPRKIVVLDDDPTGTQTVADVPVLLRPDAVSLSRFMRSEQPVCFVLANTRAMPEREAEELLGRLRRELEREAKTIGAELTVLLRGDSTLRGHAFAEIEAFATADSAALLVPAFPECGRVTIGGVHYLDEGGVRRPVAETEFARDPVFGYKSRTLTEWIEETSGGRWRGRELPLGELRRAGPAAVAESLLAAGPRTALAPDAETEEDVRLIAEGMREAERRGKPVVARTASTFVKMYAGLGSRAPRADELGRAGRLLIVCASHTEASTRQLRCLQEQFGIEPVEVPTDRLFSLGAAALVPELAGRAAAALDRQGIALVASERVRQRQHGRLADGALVMQAVTGIVRELASRVDAVVAKGGITSAQVATDGLGADSAIVSGQLEPGVSLWQLNAAGRGRRLPYAVIPGNVGTDRTMADVAGRLLGRTDGRPSSAL